MLAVAALATSGGASITPYCEAAANSTGQPGRLVATGSASVVANDLVLAASDLSAGTPMLFHYGPFQTYQPFGDGFRCVGGHIFRLEPPLFADGRGAASRAVDLTQPPANAGPGGVLPGSTWNFQTYYRDTASSGAGFNLTNGVEVVFGP